MAGTIVADTLTHSTAGSIATNYVVDGSAKAWVNFNGTGTIAARNSLNVSGLVDNSTGDYAVTLSSAMVNADYSISANGKNSTSVRTFYNSGGPSQADPTASVFEIASYNESGSAYIDSNYILTSAHGDLA